MQYQDILTITIIALPTAFAALMLMDFITGLLHLIQQPRQAITTLQPIQEPITLDDPWTLPTLPIDELPICSKTQDPLPTSLLLPPAKEKSKKPKRSKKTTAPIITDSPKHRGRPRKVA
ncbi:MAG: hypothetical protein NHB32_06455 [Fischerella sp. CENA71]|nr:hypothetical protein [Fischerella sp. CENA71]